MKFISLLARGPPYSWRVRQGRADRGVQFSKALTAKQANFATANTLEKSFVASARDWAAASRPMGRGKGDALDQNAAVAAELAKNAVAIGAELSEVRQALDDLETLKSEFPQDVRSTLVTQLTKRQRYLQEMRALLEQAGPEFLTYKANKSYAGDLFPGDSTNSKACSIATRFRTMMWEPR